MARSWLFSFDFIERSKVYLSACFAVKGRCSQIWMPGTLVGIGLNSPRYSLGASGFMSKVSRCDGPPLCHTRMQEMSLVGAARRTLSSVMPKEPSEPRRRRSRRPKRLVWLFTVIVHLSLMIV